MDTYTVNRDGSGLRKLTDEEVRQLPAVAGDTTKDKRLTVYSSTGDLYTLTTPPARSLKSPRPARPRPIRASHRTASASLSHAAATSS